MEFNLAFKGVRQIGGVEV